MKKGMRLLTVLSATILLVSGCGTPLYEITDEEETLITQYAAYVVGKHNIRQKDGMTSDKLKDEDVQKSEQQSTEQKPDSQSKPDTGSSGGTGNDTPEYEDASLAGALGYDSILDISYKGYVLQDSYQEGNYFSVNASSGNTLVVMNFVIANPGEKAVKYDTSSLKNKFYGVFDGKSKIAEKKTFSNMELSSSTKTIKVGKKTGAVMIFEISKEQASSIATEKLLVDMDGKTYQIKM